MYRVKKLFSVPIGHRLSKHCGLCKNIHGHNLKIEVTIISERLNKDDMVIDFGIMKKVVNDILDKYDHTTIINPTDTETGDFLTKAGYRIETIAEADENIDPTAEVFSKFLYDVFQQHFNLADLWVESVTIWENDNSSATYSAE